MLIFNTIVHDGTERFILENFMPTSLGGFGRFLIYIQSFQSFLKGSALPTYIHNEPEPFAVFLRNDTISSTARTVLGHSLDAVNCMGRPTHS